MSLAIPLLMLNEGISGKPNLKLVIILAKFALSIQSWIISSSCMFDSTTFWKQYSDLRVVQREREHVVSIYVLTGVLATMLPELFAFIDNVCA